MTSARSQEIKKLFSFSSLLGEMKKIERYQGQYYWREYEHAPKKYESDADHSWRLAMMVMLLEGKMQRPFNVERALKLALIHDVAEIITGDASPAGPDGTGEKAHAFNKKIKAARSRAEERAVRKIFSKLPKKQAQEFFKLWLTYEKQATFEARVVKALDKIEASLQVFEYLGGHMAKKHFDFLIKYVTASALGVDPLLDSFVKEIFAQIRRKFKEYPWPKS